MWTPAARAQLARDDIPYATSLSDAEWAVVSPFMPQPAKLGRPWAWPMRLVFNGVLYVLRTGCAWAHLPREFPPPGTVHRWFPRRSKCFAGPVPLGGVRGHDARVDGARPGARRT